MYEYNSAIVKKKYVSERYVAADIRDLRISDVAPGYSKVFLIVTHHTLPEPVAVDWDDVVEELRLYNPEITVKDWLEQRGDITLPLLSDVPVFNTKYIEYRDAWDAGFTLEPVGRGLSLEPHLDRNLLEDILVTKPGVKYDQLYHYHLPTVNGLVHKPDYSPEGYYIVDGNTTMLRANSDCVGMLSTERISKLTFPVITQDNIYALEGGLRDSLLVEFPYDITGKIIVFVLNGYLHVGSPHVVAYNDTTVKIDIQQFPMLQRYFETKDVLDWEWFQEIMTNDTNNDTHIDLEAFWSDEVIRGWFDMSQTFFATMDVDNFFIEHVAMESPDLPRRCYTYERPLWPLVGEFGRLREYSAMYEQGTWVLGVEDDKQRNYAFENRDYSNYPTLDGRGVSYKPWRQTRLHMLYMGSQVRERDNV